MPRDRDRKIVFMAAYPEDYSTPEDVPEFVSVETMFRPMDELLHKAELNRSFKQVADEMFTAKEFTNWGKFVDTMRKADHVVLALDEQKAVVGFALIVDVANRWCLEYVSVRPNQQGKKIGHHLLNLLMRKAKQLEVERIDLKCDRTKRDGYLPHLYGKFGFTICE